MSVARNNISFDAYKLKGLSRKCGFDRWRYVFGGFHSYTGDKAFFLIELYIVNPALSPNSVQYVKPQPLSGSLDTAVLLANPEPQPLPSYVAVKVGIYANRSQLFEVLYPAKDFFASKKEVHIGGGAFFADAKTLKGCVATENGKVSWNLNLDRQSSFFPKKLEKGMNWSVSGARTLFAGEVIVQDESYIISPSTSYGYVDKIWGRDYPFPFFHLSCSHMRSVISGKVLSASNFAIQGMYDNTFAFFVEISSGGQILKLSSPKAAKKHRFVCVPVDDKLHWTISTKHKGYLLDIDIFCKTNSMFVRSYTCPSNAADELQVLGGASGLGELRLYKCVGKNLEVVEQIKLEDVCCEYGGIEHVAEDL